MKTLFLYLTLLLVSAQIYSQNLQKSIWGCEMGCSKATVKKAIDKLGFKQSPTIGEKILVNNVDFCGHYFDYVVFSFYLDELHTCEFHITPKQKTEIKSYVNFFKDRYGQPDNIDNNNIHYYNDGQNFIIFQGTEDRFMIVFCNDKILNKSLKGE
ncbi:MAG TPA: hypothetical protein H9814_04390 [Candidatus Bacteroides merdigallinarum]|uniref:Uncharacterized protein n=1 Tax=Candidatus Bacteroides merdigallinarum TaxID=2838473 RepID=A0A9D2E865_9BACE|nr:hypothetical protein [Candidatus Bacteroides merdigallinarum]